MRCESSLWAGIPCRLTLLCLVWRYSANWLSLNKFLSYVTNVDKWKLMHREYNTLPETWDSG